MLTFFARCLAGAATFAAIFAAFWWSGMAESILYGGLVACVLFVAACYLAPGLMTRLISMPHTFLVHRNMGREGLELQSVTYAAYHTHWFSRMTHHGFAIDGVAWLVLAWLVVGPWATAPAIAWAAIQGRSFREPIFTAALVGVWALTAAAAGAVVHLAGPGLALTLAACVLLTNAVWRVVGHLVEPLPPDLVDNPGFLDLRETGFDLRMLRAGTLGLLAEFAAGLPYRLGVFWLYRELLRLGWRPARQIGRDEIERQSAAVHREGWAGAPATRGLS